MLRTLKNLISYSSSKASKELSELEEHLSKNKHSLWFIFPYTHIGGAEKVHANIVKVFADQDPIVIFTGKSKDEKFLNLFSQNAKVFNIPNALYHPSTAGKTKELILKSINVNEKSVLFGSNSLYFFDLVQKISDKTKCIDLIHAFKFDPTGNVIVKKLLPLAKKLNSRVFVSNAALNEFKKLLEANNFKEYENRLVYISNYVNISEYKPKSQESFTVLFVGRNSEEKRFSLVIETSEKVRQTNANVKFIAVGIKKEEFPGVKVVEFLGEITDEEKLKAIYQSANVLIVCSSREGFPMVIMEAMANGVIPISTAVGDIPNVLNSENGILISSETNIAQQMSEKINLLISDKELSNKLSKNAYEYASKNFTEEKFKEAYKKLFS